MLVPLTRAPGNGMALQLTNLDQLDQFRNQGVGSSDETGTFMHAFSEILRAPPAVEILRVENARAS